MKKSVFVGAACVAALVVGSAGCAADPEPDPATSSSAQVSAERYVEWYQLECHVPATAEQGAREALGFVSNIAGCGVGIAAAGASTATGVLAVAGVATLGATCGSAVLFVVDTIRQHDGVCYTVEKAASSCDAACRSGVAGQSFAYGTLTWPVGRPELTYCGCGTSSKAVQCRKSCDHGFGLGCDCATPAGPDPDDCGMGPSDVKCWLEDGVFATTSATPIEHRTRCKHKGQFAAGRDGTSYACVGDCSVNACVPGSAWVPARTPSSPQPPPTSCTGPNRIQDDCASLGHVACLGSSSCCWSDALGTCQYPGQKSNGVTCQCNGSY